MANRRAEIGVTQEVCRIRITEQGADSRDLEAPTLIDAVTLAGNAGVSEITVLTPGATEYPYSAGYAVPGRHARFATAEQAIAYARACKASARTAQVSALRETPDGGIYYLNIHTGEEYPRGERHRF